MVVSETSQSLVTVKTDGMYLAMFDLLSVVNSPNKWEEAMKEAHTLSASEPYKRMLHFNNIWSEYAASKCLLAWTFNFDGVYRVKVVVSSMGADTMELEAEPFIGVEDGGAQLRCPSGQLVISSLHDLGNLSMISATVLPGLYKVLLKVDWEQQDKHQFLERIDDYPSQDGPDWVLYLQKLTD